MPGTTKGTNSSFAAPAAALPLSTLLLSCPPLPLPLLLPPDDFERMLLEDAAVAAAAADSFAVFAAVLFFFFLLFWCCPPGSIIASNSTFNEPGSAAATEVAETTGFAPP